MFSFLAHYTCAYKKSKNIQTELFVLFFLLYLTPLYTYARMTIVRYRGIQICDNLFKLLKNIDLINRCYLDIP